MIIKNISCTQFAGIRDRSVSFTGGVNVVFGKNESGKSTLVNLLYRTLFQNAKLDRRSDKDFFDLFFPGAKKGSTMTGDFADGKLTFETENGTYTLSKEWGSDSRCVLSTPDGVIRDQGRINDLLREALVYGEGVYSDMLFSSQRNADLSLQTILDASKKTDAKKEIADIVSQAFAESDGISVDAIEQAINAKIEEIAGKHWDYDRDAPVRKAGRWSNGLGEILKAYYDLEDAKAVLLEISRLEADADRALSDYTTKDTLVQEAEQAYNDFNNFASRLAVQNERKKSIARIEQELRKITDILSDWPSLEENLEKAKTLQLEITRRELLDKYRAAKNIQDGISENDTETSNLPCPTDAEITQVKSVHTEILSLENKLCGMNLTAAVKMLGDYSVEIISSRTGEKLVVENGTAAISEAVRISVPGVMEMQLSPADVNVKDIENRIAERRTVINTVFCKYHVETITELEQLAKRISDAKTRLESARSRLALLLGETSFAELEIAARAIPDNVRTNEEISRDIIVVCGSNDIVRYITAKETVIEGYRRDYGSIKDLKAKAFDLNEELNKARDTVSGTTDIPAEYLSIADPNAHLKSLSNALTEKRNNREAALTAKTTAESKLESYKENISGDPFAEEEKAERAFEEQKALLRHWRHISDVFMNQKQNLHANPMQDISDKFMHYLDVISGGKVSTEFPEADKLEMHIYSENRLLDYGKLSEGTKETVFLAFRLAVLDHLFPDGSGVIVFDDPFTDMDSDRTAQACDLINECAKRHQVIFLTCDEKYLELLQGNNVKF